jgi:pantoate--beta-alanine ligase
MSSRNRYLSPEERKQALVLSRAIKKMEQLMVRGERSSQKLIAGAREIFAEEPSVRIDYVSVVDPDTLEDVPDVRGTALAAVAAFVGNTRLIDNVLLVNRP